MQLIAPSLIFLTLCLNAVPVEQFEVGFDNFSSKNVPPTTTCGNALVLRARVERKSPVE